MLIHDFEQNSPEWYDARCGVITASTFGSVLTPAKMELSSQSKGIEYKTIAELITGQPAEEFCGNYHVDRGKELEPDAVSLYELIRDCSTEIIGFVTNDDKTIGCSPDRLIGDKGLLEIKCPAPHTHLKYFFEGGIDTEYKPQIQGQLMITNRDWCDIMSYHPEMQPVIKRVKRDEEYILKLAAALDQLWININEKMERIKL